MDKIVIVCINFIFLACFTNNAIVLLLKESVKCACFQCLIDCEKCK